MRTVLVRIPAAAVMMPARVIIVMVVMVFRIPAAAVVMPVRVIIVMVVMVFVFRILAAAGMMRMLRMAVGGGVLAVPGGDLGVRLAVPCDFQKRRDESIRVGGGEPKLLCGEGDGNLLHAGDLGELLLDLGGAVGTVDTRDDIYLFHGVLPSSLY